MTARRTHCPAGRPLYRYGDLPADRLATKTMLTRQRRRPAVNQEPVASYWTGHQYVPLYTITDAVPLPPLSPGRAAVYARNRTCARCEATSPDPFEPDASGKRRVCRDCRLLESRAGVAPSWVVGRIAASAWAREVLADPRCVLLYRVGVPIQVGARSTWHGDFGHPHQLCAASTTGAVLLNTTVYPARPSPVAAPRLPGSILAVDIAGLIVKLAERRQVSWGVGQPLGLCAADLRHDEATRALMAPLPYPAGWVSVGDDFATRYSAWRAQPLRGHAWPGIDGLERQLPPPGADAATVVALMAGLLAAMARDDHPDGPPVCPILAPAGLQPCGVAPLPQSGKCPGHTPATTVALPQRFGPLARLPGRVNATNDDGQIEVDIGKYGLVYADAHELTAVHQHEPEATTAC